MEHIKHGVNNFVLEDYDWDPETGRAVLEYSRYVPGQAEPEVRYVTVNHPALPHHDGWVAN